MTGRRGKSFWLKGERRGNGDGCAAMVCYVVYMITRDWRKGLDSGFGSLELAKREKALMIWSDLSIPFLHRISVDLTLICFSMQPVA